MDDRWATFDCYGTLIDWMGGLRSALAEVWSDADPGRLLARYHELEPGIQAGRGLPYRQVLAEGLQAVAVAEGLVVPDGRAGALGDSLPGWPVFPEVPASLTELRRRGWRLAILSNTDVDFLDASLTAIGVPVDLRVVASQIGSYKPAPGHWEVFFRESGADPKRHVHVGRVTVPRCRAMRPAGLSVRLDRSRGGGRHGTRHGSLDRPLGPAGYARRTRARLTGPTARQCFASSRAYTESRTSNWTAQL